MPTHEEMMLVMTSFFLILLEATQMYEWCRNRIPRPLEVPRIPFATRNAHRAFFFDRLFRHDSRSCYNNLRMHRGSFYRLCTVLKTYGLSDSRFVNVQEQVAIFLLCVGHDTRNRSQVLQFIRSGQTISHYFHLVLDSCLRLFNDIVTPPTADNSPVDGGVDCHWHHYFEDAVGAIDGTHFPVNVPLDEQTRYRNRKDIIDDIESPVNLESQDDGVHVLSQPESTGSRSKLPHKKSTPSLKRARSRFSTKEEIEVCESFKTMAKASADMAGAMSKMAAASEVDYAELEALLYSIPGLEDHHVVGALDFLVGDQNMANMFKKVSEKSRGAWIRMKLGLSP